ncbi:MAG TPA: ABC-2 family transporter protein [Oligoflexia bacterium]|nr:ABC-2 family transporter protein [Oligoflexia bacterium]HMP47830.1 ABC-2 family transporter protein [Oligoflexia bacterium]
MTILKLHIDPYIANVRLAFLKLLAYRLRYFTGLITYTLFVSVHYFIWKAVFGAKASETASDISSVILNGYSLSDMITYIAVGWIARSLYFSDIDEEIASLVRSGQVSIYLLRPVYFHLMLLSEAFGGMLFRFTLFTFPIAFLLLALFPIQAPYSFFHAILFILSTFMSFFVLAELNFLLGLVCFALKSIDGIMRAKYFFVQLFSGLLLPLAFFPDWLRYYLNILPFKLIASVPLEVYLGRLNGVDLYYAIIETAGWGMFLFFLCEISWRSAFRSLSIQGG